MSKGMTCTMYILPLIMKMRYVDHDIISLTEINVDPYVPATMPSSNPVAHIPHDKAQGLEISGLLGLINMSHFERLVEANACMK